MFQARGDFHLAVKAKSSPWREPAHVAHYLQSGITMSAELNGLPHRPHSPPPKVPDDSIAVDPRRWLGSVQWRPGHVIEDVGATHIRRRRSSLLGRPNRRRSVELVDGFWIHGTALHYRAGGFP